MKILNSLEVCALKEGAPKRYYLGGQRVSKAFFNMQKRLACRQECFQTVVSKTHVRHFSNLHFSTSK